MASWLNSDLILISQVELMESFLTIDLYAGFVQVRSEGGGAGPEEAHNGPRAAL